MKGELPASNMWQYPKTESVDPLFHKAAPGHEYEELPAKSGNLNFVNDYLTVRGSTPEDSFPSHPVLASRTSASIRKRGENPIYSGEINAKGSAESTTTGDGGILKVLIILIVIVALIAVVALIMAAYSIAQLQVRADNNVVSTNQTDGDVENLKEQIRQLQRENLQLPIKIAKLLGFDPLPDNSSLMLSDLLSNNSQIVAMLSDKVLQLIASSADGYRNLSTQANNLSTILALVTQQQQLQTISWSNQLTLVQNNLTSQIVALSRLPGPQGPPGPATTVNLSSCAMEMISKGGVLQLPNISTNVVNLQAMHPDMIVTGVTCTTDYGTSALLNTDVSSTKYFCTCSGINTQFPSATSRYCYMIYWLCPRIFRGG